VFDFLADQNFLNALALMIGPMAFFAAPTEEIEFLLLDDDETAHDMVDDVPSYTPSYTNEEAELAKAA
jgi:hypothetical protein